MTEQEKDIVNNIANKLEILLNKDKVTILALSKLLKVDKQPLYRIMKREHIPNILFLEMIASYLNCTVLELIDKKFYLDIKVYFNYEINNKSKYEKYRAYFCDDDFMDISNNEFFGIIIDSSIKIFYKIDKVTQDGDYLICNGMSACKEIHIISVGKSLIIALINNKEVRLKHDEISVIAKLYKTVSIIQSEGYAFKH